MVMGVLTREIESQAIIHSFIFTPLKMAIGGILIPNKMYTECPRRNMSDFGRVFLMLKYTDITQNTYVQS